MNFSLSELSDRSHFFLGSSNNNLTKDSIEELRDILREHNRLYYMESTPIISDKEYDTLFKLLSTLEKKYEAFDASSPTAHIDVALSRQFEKAKHLSSMISLDNTYDASDVADFEKRIRNILKTETPLDYIVELKFDGLGISILYRDGKLFRALTRGNGVEGEDITVNALQIKNIPRTIPYDGEIEIRGEVVMPHAAFHRVNDERLLSWEKLFANPRNAASGSLRQLDYSVTANRGLEFIAYSVPKFEGVIASDDDFSGDKSIATYQEYTAMLAKWGFTISPYLFHANSLAELQSEIAKLTDHRPSFPFDIDGLVLKLNQISLWKELGTTEHHPRYAIAYKFPQVHVRTKVLDVEHSVGRSGIVTPVAHLEAVNVTGVTVRRATLHNYDELEAKDVRIGDQVFIIRAGEVIPEVIASISEVRSGQEKIVERPTVCPSCGGALTRDEGKVAIYCPNRATCPAQTLGALAVYVSKHAAHIDGFGEKGIVLFLEKGLLSDFLSFYRLAEHREEILALEGFETKKTDNLLSEIEKSRNMPLPSLLVALGIPEVGRKTGKTLAEYIAKKCLERYPEGIPTTARPVMIPSEKPDLQLFPSEEVSDNLLSTGPAILSVMRSFSPEELMEISDIGPSTAESVVSYLEENSEMLEELFLELSPVLPSVKTEGKFSGLSFCVTGSFEGISRDEIHEIIESLGGEVRSSVSSKLDYLVVGSDAGSKLIKANELGVKTITIEEWKRMCE